MTATDVTTPRPTTACSFSASLPGQRACRISHRLAFNSRQATVTWYGRSGVSTPVATTGWPYAGVLQQTRDSSPRQPRCRRGTCTQGNRYQTLAEDTCSK